MWCFVNLYRAALFKVCWLPLYEERSRNEFSFFLSFHFTTDLFQTIWMRKAAQYFGILCKAGKSNKKGFSSPENTIEGLRRNKNRQPALVCGGKPTIGEIIHTNNKLVQSNSQLAKAVLWLWRCDLCILTVHYYWTTAPENWFV